VEEGVNRMRCSDFESDVTDAVGLGEPCMVRGSVFVPDDPLPGAVVVLVAIPVGTYTPAYWNLVVPNREAHSFAEHFAERGAIVIAVDNLGTGASTQPRDGDRLTVDVLATANHAAVTDIVARMATGAVDGVPPVTGARIVGVGHSLGGHLVTAQQSLFADYERIAVFGSSFLGSRHLRDLSLDRGRTLLEQRSAGGYADGYLRISRSELRPQHHADDVPDDVLAAADALVTVLPRTAAATAVASQLLVKHPFGVSAPVFLAFGDTDVSDDPRAEVALYGSSDTTLLLLPASAHCHNMAGSRQMLWNRLAQWLGLEQR
jgi:alpha-beta hydrolase superfamily lysophospholipase